MTVFTKILQGSARIHQLSLDLLKSTTITYPEGSIIITDEKMNVHQIQAMEQVWILDIMDNHPDVKCNYYNLSGNTLLPTM
jgi:hypothetical protein